MLNSFFIVWLSDNIPIALRPVQFLIGYLARDEQISLTWIEFPLKKVVNINVPKLIKTNNKPKKKKNFLFSELSSKKYIIKKIVKKKNNPSCINKTKGKEKIIKIIDNFFFFRNLIKKIKNNKMINNKISFLPIAPILYIIKGRDSGDKIINKFWKFISSFFKKKYNCV